MLGREVNQPPELMFPVQPWKESKRTEVYCSNLVESFESAHNVAKEQLRGTIKRMKRDYDVKVRKYQFNKGQRKTQIW